MKRISRRNFLKVAGVGAAALGLAASADPLPGSLRQRRFFQLHSFQHGFFRCCICRCC